AVGCVAGAVLPVGGVFCVAGVVAGGGRDDRCGMHVQGTTAAGGAGAGALAAVPGAFPGGVAGTGGRGIGDGVVDSRVAGDESTARGVAGDGRAGGGGELVGGALSV